MPLHSFLYSLIADRCIRYSYLYRINLRLQLFLDTKSTIDHSTPRLTGIVLMTSLLALLAHFSQRTR